MALAGTLATWTTFRTDAADYYPYGKILREYKACNQNRYLSTHHERDKDTGYDNRGARLYDSEIGRFTGVDPLAEKFSAWSPYHYVYDNPLIHTDPTGMAANWIPDSNGDLIAEKGDDATTLATFLNVSHNEASQVLEKQFYITTDGEVTLQKGDVVQLDNVFTKSIDQSNSTLTTNAVLSGSAAATTVPKPEDRYNCWGAACAGSQGKKIEVGVGIKKGATFDANLTRDYTPITESNAQFGETVLRFSDGKNQAQHGAVFYGKSQDGTSFVYTKNGWGVKPEVMKLSDIKSKIPSYGTVKGVNPSNSGYYDPK